MNNQEIDRGQGLREILQSVLEELHQPPYGLHVEIQDYDQKELKWQVKVSRFTAEITAVEIEDAEKRYGDIRNALKNLVFEKFQWAVCEA